MVRRLLQGKPLTEFESKASTFNMEMVEHLDRCLEAVCNHIFPTAALKRQKRYMQRVVRKPPTMNIRAYYARYQELNRYLDQFPPFGNRSQMLPTDEVMEHMEFAIPHSWQKQMILQGFNTVEHTMDEFLEFCERLETAEDIFDFTHKKTQKGKSENGNSEDPDPQVGSGRQNTGRKRKTSSDLYYCLYHGSNTTHNMHQCKIMKSQAKKMATPHEGKGGKYKYERDPSKNRAKDKKDYESFLNDVCKQV